MPKPYPREFRDDVVRVARNREPGIHLKQIAADFGISESCLTGWLKAADVEDGVKPGTTAAENAENRELRNECASWSRRTRSCAARRPISRRPTCRENDVPARPRASAPDEAGLTAARVSQKMCTPEGAQRLHSAQKLAAD